MYLGAKVKKTTLENGSWCWYLSPYKYVQEAVRNCEQTLKDTYSGTYKFPNSAPNPLPMGYRPEKDVSKPLGPDLASYYQSLIGECW